MSYNIIKNRGDAKKATTHDGKKKERQDKLWHPDRKAFIPCAPYDNHFIYDTDTIGPRFMCTCGSEAIIPIGPEFPYPVLRCKWDMDNGGIGLHQNANKRWV